MKNLPKRKNLPQVNKRESKKDKEPLQMKNCKLKQWYALSNLSDMQNLRMPNID